MSTEDFLERQRDLSNGSRVSRRTNRELQEVALPRFRGSGQTLQSGFDSLRIAVCSQPP
jgi:hypothetical protein